MCYVSLLPQQSSLGKDRSAPRELIDSAYRTLVKLHHPDRLPVPERDRGHRRMVEINGAYEALHAHAVPGGV